jgi:protein TonB
VPAPRETTPAPEAPAPAPPTERAAAAPPAPPTAPAAPATGAPTERGESRVAALPTPAPEPPRPDIRSALRRGAGGGAGGLTGGRGGIEGEPIPLDTDDPRFSDYLDRVRRLIRSKWGFPCAEGNPHAAQCVRREGELVIEFGIAKDGHVPFVNLRDSSGSVNMDDFALNAVRLASPFPPIPDAVSRKGIPIIATFRYLIREELINVLR